jgi:hypothetical protein
VNEHFVVALSDISLARKIYDVVTAH